MTIPEVNRAIKAWGWRENRNHTYISSLAYIVPTLIAKAVLEGKDYPEIYDIFPNEFNKEDILEHRRKLQIQKDMDTFRAWAEAYNQRHEEGNE